MDNELKQKLIDAGYKGDFGLEELIEACGDVFWQISRNQHGEWQAIARNVETHIATHVENGSTPFEAAANLYIALNTK